MDVNWHRQDGRMMLQDELDIVEPVKSDANAKPAEERLPSKPYELVAIAYRQLISNFEKVSAYDLAEDCWCGAMEMKRIDPNQPIPSRVMASLYRLASKYGTSYQHALAILGLLVLIFVLLFSVIDIRPNPTLQSLSPSSPVNSIKALKAGLVHALEVATFQRQPRYLSANLYGHCFEMLEQLLLAVQVPLVLLALRRRFRR